MKLENWTVCPDCNLTDHVTLDIADHGEDQRFISFYCENCEYGSLEDDFRWWVYCPNCMVSQDIPVDHVEGDSLEDGKIEFECNNCGKIESDYPSSKWDST